MKNRVILIGRLGKDPELKETASSKVASFSLATSDRYKDRSGEIHEDVQWHNIEAWGTTAEVLHRYAKKGSLLEVTGKIEYKSWDSPDGSKRYKTVINVREFTFLDRKENKPEQSESNDSSKETQTVYDSSTDKHDDGTPF